MLLRGVIKCRCNIWPIIRLKGGTRGLHIVRQYSDTSANNAAEKELPDSDTHRGLYRGHIPTSFFQKSLLSVGSAAMAITKPWRDDMVSTLGETTGQFALMSMKKKMESDPVGREILREKPEINTSSVDIDYLRSLPEGTFGKEYADFLDKNEVTPDARKAVVFVDDVELAYVMTRYRQVHDLLHTVLGMPTNMLGEVVVKWVEAIQTGLPMCVTGALFGPVRLKQKHMQKYLETHIWWAIRNGRNAKFLLNIYYEKHWEMPMEDFRKELNLEPPPHTPQKKKL